MHQDGAGLDERAAGLVVGVAVEATAGGIEEVPPGGGADLALDGRRVDAVEGLPGRNEGTHLVQRRGRGGIDVVEAVAAGEAHVAIAEGVPVVVVAPQEDAVGGDAARQKEREVVLNGPAVAAVAGQVGQAEERRQRGLIPVGGATLRGVDEAVGALHERGRTGVVCGVGAGRRIEGGHEHGRRLGAVAVGAVRDQGVRVAPQGGEVGRRGDHLSGPPGRARPEPGGRTARPPDGRPICRRARPWPSCRSAP